MRDETPAREDRAVGLNASVPWHVTSVRALPQYMLAVRFADGTEGTVDLWRLALGTRPGVFGALRDPAFFALATVEDGVVSWPGELDLAPDAMYDAIRARGSWTPE